MTQFRRVHHTGSETTVLPHLASWSISIKVSEPGHKPATIVGYLMPTAEAAKTRAEQELANYGHVCNESCKGWEALGV